MNYIIDPKVFSAVFTVPAAVADQAPEACTRRAYKGAALYYAEYVGKSR